MSDFDGGAGDAESDYIGKRVGENHETMKDDIYRKRFDYSAEEDFKLPTWASVLIFGIIVVLYILIFRP